MMKKFCTIILIIALTLVSLSSYAIEFHVGGESFILEDNASFTIELQSYDVDGILKTLDDGAQAQLLRDLLAATLIADALQHNSFADTSSLSFDDLLNVLPLVTGVEDMQIEGREKIYLSDMSYLHIKEDADRMTALSLVFPQIENGFGNALAVDFSLPK